MLQLTKRIILSISYALSAAHAPENLKEFFCTLPSPPPPPSYVLVKEVDSSLEFSGSGN